MKRSLALSVGIATFLLAMATWVSAATMDDIAGTWGVYSKAKGKVSKLGGENSEGFGAMRFERGAPGSNTGSFDYFDPEGYIYTGYFTLSQNGKQLTMELDNNGRQEFEEMMRTWLQRSASGEGLILENIYFDYDEKGILMSTLKTSEKKKGPIKGTVSAKGIVYADLDEGNNVVIPVSGKFSFKSTTKFLLKQHP